MIRFRMSPQTRLEALLPNVVKTRGQHVDPAFAYTPVTTVALNLKHGAALLHDVVGMAVNVIRCGMNLADRLNLTAINTLVLVNKRQL